MESHSLGLIGNSQFSKFSRLSKNVKNVEVTFRSVYYMVQKLSKFKTAKNILFTHGRGIWNVDCSFTDTGLNCNVLFSVLIDFFFFNISLQSCYVASFFYSIITKIFLISHCIKNRQTVLKKIFYIFAWII